jgi:hypothetical protein
MTVVPGVAATVAVNDPSAAAVVSAVAVENPVSVLVAATDTMLPAAVVPVTVTGDPLIADSLGGEVTVSDVVPCW